MIYRLRVANNCRTDEANLLIFYSAFAGVVIYFFCCGIALSVKVDGWRFPERLLD